MFNNLKKLLIKKYNNKNKLNLTSFKKNNNKKGKYL